MADLTSQPTTIQSIYTWHNENKLQVNRRYQRKLVWTLQEKQKLVESILKRYPIPAILLAELDGTPGSYEIIDGLQRLHAIISFIETAFPTLTSEYFDIKHFTTAQNRADEGIFKPNEFEKTISNKDVGNFLDYTLAISVMRNASEHEINDVFDRINTYGRRLSDQERRQSGVENDFSQMIREIACALRGDTSSTVLPLALMPSISIDLPKTKHGYDIKAEEVFWVRQGILRATDLRDSMDEQCIADVAASIIGGMIIDRSKEALDEIYSVGSVESNRIESALTIYGAEKFADEFKFCVDEILKICGDDKKLRDIVFAKGTTNAFPSVFAVIVIALHELIISEGKMISNYDTIRKLLTGISDRIGTGRKTTSPEERRKNIDVIKGLVRGSFVKRTPSIKIYGSHATADIENIIRRSEIELSHYELKQGLIALDPKSRTEDKNLIAKVIRTIAAIANNGPEREGKIIVGVADDESDATKISKLDKITPIKVSKKQVVGVAREANLLGLTAESYFSKWKNAIKNSSLSEPLKSSVLASMDYNDFFGLGVIVITIPAQKEISYAEDKVFIRSGDDTVLVDSAKQIADVVKRF
jgi:Protein of unknown function DUF262/Putative DNA-binding domain